MLFSAVFILASAFCGSFAGYSASDSENKLDTGDSTSYGYSGSFSGSGLPPGNTFIPFYPQWDFGGFLSSYINSLNKHHQEFMEQLQKNAETAFAHAQAAQGANVHPQDAGGQVNLPGASGFNLGNRGGFIGGYGGGFAGPGGSGYSFSGPIGQGPGYGAASASGSIGPGGVHQSASIFPESAKSPNINTRFGGSDADNNNGGFKSVFTSSKTVSTNIDGKPQTFRQASTTVNNNGKVTSYTVQDP